MWDDEIKLIVEQRKIKQSISISKQRSQTMTLNISTEQPLPKQKSENAIANQWKNLYHSQNLPYTK